MKLKHVIPLLIIALLGCGQVEEHTIYDTANNPDDFPHQAVGLLVSLENGQLSDAEAITTAFGDLYTGNSDLLDDEDWKMVIERLGVRFGQIADSLSALGLANYESAGEYFQLASFARPDDQAFRCQAALFATWLDGIQPNNLIDLAAFADKETPELTDLIDVAAYFLGCDTDHQEFYRTYLTEPMKRVADARNLLVPEALDSLSPADREILTTAGLVTP